MSMHYVDIVIEHETSRLKNLYYSKCNIVESMIIISLYKIIGKIQN